MLPLTVYLAVTVLGVALTPQAVLGVDAVSHVTDASPLASRRYTVVAGFKENNIAAHGRIAPVCSMYSDIALAIAHAMKRGGADVATVCCPLGGSLCRSMRDVRRNVSALGALDFELGVYGEVEDVLIGTAREGEGHHWLSDAVYPLWRDLSAPGRHVVVLGSPEMLLPADGSMQSDSEGASPPPLYVHLVESGWLPSDAILYDFEYIGVGNAGFHFVLDGSYAAMLQTFPCVWTYSVHNAQALQSLYGIQATHCPVGWSSHFESVRFHRWAHGTLTRPREELDVLFYGSMTHHRKSVLDSLYSQGVTVSILRYDSDRWGEALVDVLMRAKIVLVLSAWRGPGEFKMSRLAPLLANERLAVVEDTAVDKDIDYYRDGLVVVPEGDLLSTLVHLLAHDSERHSIARRGRELFLSRPMADTIAPCVRRL